MSTAPLLSATTIAKAYAGVRVLEGVQFELRAGEVHTLLGENGAGKSTLMKILAGVVQPDGGTLALDGEAITLNGPQAAMRRGIALIHQEPLNFPDLSVAENIHLGRSGVPRGAVGQIDWSTMNRRAAELLRQLGVSLDPRQPMRGLSIADQQMVELAAALSQNARVLLMDEPTAALTPGEVSNLFAIVRRLKSQGVGIVFISHRLPEVFEISDRITVLRDGHFVGTRAVSETNTDEIVQMMVGRPLSSLFEKPTVTPGEVVLRVDGLSRRDEFQDIGFDVRAGEIVGFAGLVGAGRTQVAQAIFGVTRPDAGTISLDGKPIRVRHPADAIGCGIAYVPEDRAQHGLLLPMSITANTTLASLRDVSTAGVLSGSRERAMAERWRGALKTRLRDVDQPVLELSGGNQQKVVLSKWLERRPRVLIVDEPTRGIDIGAKAEVHHVLAELAKQGTAIVMISSDLPEVLAMSDRVIVMREGRITGTFARGEANQENVMRAATLGAHASGPPLPPGEGLGERARADVESPAEPRGSQPLPAPSPQPSPEGRGSQTDDLPIAQPVDLEYAPSPQPSPRGRGSQRTRELGVAVFVAIVFGAVAFKEPRFAHKDTLYSILLALPLMVILATGQLFAILSRNIDLSVGSMLGLSAIVAGGLFVTHPGMPVPVALAVAIGVGALLGLLNGTLVALLRVPAIIATLGTLTAYRGLAYMWSGGRQVAIDSLPPALLNIAKTGPLGVPWFVVIAACVAVAATIFLRYSTTGRQIFALGSNPRAAELRGVPTKRVTLLLFTLSGMCAGLAGILYGARFGTINPGDAGSKPPMELIAISAVVLGGAAVNGGAGSVPGTILGCLLLAIVEAATSMLSISLFWQRVFYGGTILLAVTVDALLRRRRA